MPLSDLIIGIESGGNPNAKSQSSSAAGAAQFLAGTWLDMIGRYRPDLSTGKSPAEVLALRSDPDLSKAMTDENAQRLTGAGFEATPANTYLAHFAGPQGALGVLKASPGTPVADVLGHAVVKANPFLAGMTAGELQLWAGRKMGGAALAPMASGAPHRAQGQAIPAFLSADSAPAQQAPTGLAGLLGGVPQQQAPAMEMPPLLAGQPRRPPDLTKLMQMAQTRPPLGRGFY